LEDATFGVVDSLEALTLRVALVMVGDDGTNCKIRSQQKLESTRQLQRMRQSYFERVNNCHFW
jgi:hypothetical protein